MWVIVRVWYEVRDDVSRRLNVAKLSTAFSYFIGTLLGYMICGLVCCVSTTRWSLHGVFMNKRMKEDVSLSPIPLFSLPAQTTKSTVLSDQNTLAQSLLSLVITFVRLLVWHSTGTVVFSPH